MLKKARLHEFLLVILLLLVIPSFSLLIPPEKALSIVNTGEYSCNIKKISSLEGYIYYNYSCMYENGNLVNKMTVNVTAYNFIKDAFENPSMSKCRKIKKRLKEDYPSFSCSNANHRNKLSKKLKNLKNNKLKIIQDGVDRGFITRQGNVIIATIPKRFLNKKGLIKVGEFESGLGSTIINEYQEASMIEYVDGGIKTNVTLKEFDNNSYEEEIVVVNSTYNYTKVVHEGYVINPHDIFISGNVDNWKFWANDTGSNLTTISKYQYDVLSNEPLTPLGRNVYGIVRRTYYVVDNIFGKGSKKRITEYDTFDFSDIASDIIIPFNSSLNLTYSSEISYKYEEFFKNETYFDDIMNATLNRTVFSYSRLRVYFKSNSLIDPEISETTQSDFDDGYFNQTEWDGVYSGIRLKNDTVLSMDFEDDVVSAGKDTVKDQSLSGNDGTLGSSTVGDSAEPTWTSSGYSGGAYEFDGVDDYVDLGDFPEVENTAEFSIEMWILDTTTASQENKDSYLLGKNNLINLDYPAWKTTRFLVRNGSEAAVSVIASAYVVGEWTHIVGTFDTNANISIYKNGVKDASSVVPDGFGNTNANNNNLWIGSNGGYQVAATWWNGTVDQVRIYSRALTAAEVLSRYNGSLANQTSKYREEGHYYSDFFNANGSTAVDWTNMTWDSAENGSTECTDSNLVLCMKFDDDSSVGEDYEIQGYGVDQAISGNWTVYDYSTAGNNGTVYPASQYKWVTGNVSNGLSFDGVDDYVSGVSIDIDKSFTIDTWINPVVIDTTINNIVEIDQGLPLFQFYVRTDGGQDKILVFLRDGSSNKISKTVLLSENVWTHVAVSWNNVTKNLTLYKNGNVGASGVNTNIDITDITNAITNIGTRSGTAVNYFNGTIDEFRIYHRALNSSEISDSYNSGLAGNPSNVSNDSLVLYMPLDESSGTSAGYEANAWVDAKVSKGLDFDGTDDYVDLPAISGINGTNEFTITAWAKFDSFSGSQNQVFAISNGTGYPDRTIEFFAFNNDMRTFLWNSSGSLISLVNTTQNMNTDTWYHVALAYNGSGKVKIYENAVVVATTDAFGTLNAKLIDAWIGRRYEATADYMVGSIDELRIWNRTLSSTEILNIYTNESTGQNDPNMDRTNLIGEWTLNETTGTNASDSSGEGNDGTLTNFRNDYFKPQATGTLSGYVLPLMPTAYGKCGGGLEFDGVDDYIKINYSESMNLINITIEAWVKTGSENTGYKSLVVKDNYNEGGTRKWFDLGTSYSSYDGKPFFSTSIGASIKAQSTLSINDNKWHYLVGVRDAGNTVSLYIDGILEKSVSDTSGGGVIDSVTQTTIGAVANTVFSSEFFNGTLDQVMIYNRSLNASEVYDHYKKGLVCHPGNNITFEVRTWNYVDSDGRDNYDSVDANMVLWMEFDNNSNLGEDYNASSRNIFDMSNAKNNGTTIGTIKYNGTGGKFIGAYEFDGVDDYIDLGNPTSLQLQNFTYSIWFKHNTTRSWQSLYGQYSITGRNNIYLSGSDTLNYYQAGATPTSCTGSITITKDVWHHVGVTKDGTDVKLYLDGVEDNACDMTGDISFTNNFVIGSDSGSNEYVGFIDSVAIFNRSLNASEIERHYIKGLIKWDNNFTSVNKSSSFSSDIGDGQYAQYKATYRTNNTDTTHYLFNVSINWQTAEAVTNTAPNVSITNPSNDSTVRNSITINWTVNNTEGDYLLTNVTIDSTIIASQLLNNTLNVTWDSSSVSNGQYNLTVKACENSTTDLLCGNDTILITISNDNRTVLWKENLTFNHQVNLTSGGDYILTQNPTDSLHVGAGAATDEGRIIFQFNISDLAYNLNITNITLNLSVFLGGSSNIAFTNITIDLINETNATHIYHNISGTTNITTLASLNSGNQTIDLSNLVDMVEDILGYSKREYIQIGIYTYTPDLPAGVADIHPRNTTTAFNEQGPKLIIDWYTTRNVPPYNISLTYPSDGQYFNVNRTIINYTNATDPDGDPVTNFTIYIDDNSDFSSPTLARNSSNLYYNMTITEALIDMDNWYIRVCPLDSVTLEQGTCSDSISIIIDAQPPQIVNITRSPIPAYNNDSINFSAYVDGGNPIDCVWYESNYTGTLQNFTTCLSSSSDPDYYVIIGSGNFSNQENFVFRFYANDTGNTTQRGEQIATNISNRAPTAFTGLSPTNNTDVNRPATLSWDNVTDPDFNNGCELGGCYFNYTLYFSSNRTNVSSKLQGAIVMANTTNISWDYTNGTDDTIYYWQVIANDTLNTTESEIRQFTLRFPLGKVTNLEANFIGHTYICYNWTNPTESKFNSVNISHKEINDTSYTQQSNTTDTDICIRSLHPGTTYSLKIEPVDIYNLIGNISYLNTTTKTQEVYLKDKDVTIKSITANISIASPQNNTNLTSSPDFVYNISSVYSIEYCSLIVNNSIKSTDSSIIRSFNQTISYSLTNGYYSWYIQCRDFYNTLANSDSYVFNLSIPTTSTETTTTTVSQDEGVKRCRWIEETCNTYNSRCCFGFTCQNGTCINDTAKEEVPIFTKITRTKLFGFLDKKIPVDSYIPLLPINLGRMTEGSSKFWNNIFKFKTSDEFARIPDIYLIGLRLRVFLLILIMTILTMIIKYSQQIKAKINYISAELKRKTSSFPPRNS